jgi:hypothetical protein
VLIQKLEKSACNVRCEKCGSQSVFELQLLPPLIHLLRVSKDAGRHHDDDDDEEVEEED